MTGWGYTVSSEEHGPRRLVDLAVQAEGAGADQEGFMRFWTKDLRDPTGPWRG